MGVFNYVKADEGDKCPYCNVEIEEWQTKELLQGEVQQNTVTKDEVIEYHTWCENCKKGIDYQRKTQYSKEFYLVGSGADISSEILDTDNCISINYSDDTVDIDKLHRDLKEVLYGCQIHQLAQLITKDHSVELENNSWVSVDDRLPNKDGWYLVYFRFLCEIKKFSNGEWQNQRLGSKITHWQPLPQPPFIIRMKDLKDE